MRSINRSFSLKLLLVLLISGLMLMTPQVINANEDSSPRPVINSQWTNTPPSIDGTKDGGEWSNLQISFTSADYPADYVLPTYVYFMNDQDNLYVLVNAVGDTDDDQLDECLLIFDSNSNPQDGFVVVRITGSSEPTTWSKSSSEFSAAIGFNGHKVYEFAIPFTFLNAQPGQPLDFCSPFYKSTASMPYDSTGGYDNVWPQILGKTSPDSENWKSTIEIWGILNTQGQPYSPHARSYTVGGFIMPVNKLTLLTPYLALLGIIAIITSSAIVIKKRHKP